MTPAVAILQQQGASVSMTGARGAIVVALTAAVLAGLWGCGAFASPGCDAVNAKQFDDTAAGGSYFKKTITGFEVGDVVTIVIRCRVDVSDFACRDMSTQFMTGSGYKIAGKSRLRFEYTVDGIEQDSTLTFGVFKHGPPARTEGTCKPAGAKEK
jgi:hypothetical protein